MKEKDIAYTARGGKRSPVMRRKNVLSGFGGGRGRRKPPSKSMKWHGTDEGGKDDFLRIRQGNCRDY